MNEQNIQLQKPYKILLIGDNCTDIYQYGSVDRISPEAPVPVFVPIEKVEREGMAGNVYLNLKKLGCNVDLVCGHASKKTRLVDIRSKQQILRIDEDVTSTPVDIVDGKGYDAIVISDYNKGVVDYRLIEHLAKTALIPVFIDTKKKDLRSLNGLYIKINELEYNSAITMAADEWLITTHGKFGAMYKGVMYPAPDVGEVTDVCGAGDTFLAALVYKFLETDNMHQAIEFANKASAITVQHFGNYAPSLEEIQ